MKVYGRRTFEIDQDTLTTREIGWDCVACGVFNGLEKENRTTCRACEAPRRVRAVTIALPGEDVL